MSIEAREIDAAANELVAAFGLHDKHRYFSCFSPDAVFLFHNHHAPLVGRQAYMDLWDSWESQDDFRVLSCISSDRIIQIIGRVAILSHTVRTRVSTAAGESHTQERETVVFEKRNDRLLVVHEHLSLHESG
ncbi:MAG: nuclear transport factor 2 family protein [Parvibaculaceae bacterium]